MAGIPLNTASPSSCGKSKKVQRNEFAPNNGTGFTQLKTVLPCASTAGGVVCRSIIGALDLFWLLQAGSHLQCPVLDVLAAVKCSQGISHRTSGVSVTRSVILSRDLSDD